MKSIVFAITLLCASCQAQIMQQVLATVGGSAITLDANCQGHGTTNLLVCSSAMTVTAGDAITCNVTGVSGGNRITGTVVDSVNGFYRNVYGLVHPSSTDSFASTAVIENSAGGSITPTLFFNNTPNTEGTLNCYAWKGVATSGALDGGAVEQTATATAANPISPMAAAPTNSSTNLVRLSCPEAPPLLLLLGVERGYLLGHSPLLAPRTCGRRRSIRFRPRPRQSMDRSPQAAAWPMRTPS